ncbi:MAG: corrinoid protein [Phycisphaerales bacterium]
MSTDALSERLFEALINGDRPMARAITTHALDSGLSYEELVSEVYYPTYETIAKLYRNDQLTRLAHHMATRLLRSLADQAAAGFEMLPSNGRTVTAFCGPTDADELGAQMAIDLVEREGFQTTFVGPGVAADEILAFVQNQQPDCLVIFASAPCDLPEIRELIDRMREIGACNGTQIIVGGGVFNRADGLAEEIGADLWASDPVSLVERMIEEPERRADESQRTVGAVKPAPRKRSRKAA